MKVLCQMTWVLTIADDQELGPLVSQWDETLASELRSRINPTLDAHGVTTDGLDEAFEWYGLAVLPLRSMEQLLDD